MDLRNATLLSSLGWLSFSAPVLLKFASGSVHKNDARPNSEGAARERERGARSMLRLRNLVAAYSTAGVLKLELAVFGSTFR